MTEAVIVAGGPHAHRASPQGLAAGRRRLRPGQASSWARPSPARASPPPTSTTSSWPRSLQGGGVIARYVALRTRPDRRARPGQQPPLRGRPERGADRRRQHPGRHGPGRGGRRHREPELVARGRSSPIPASAIDPQPWMSPSHPEQADAPQWDMSITVGENTARLAGISRADVGRVGAAIAPAGGPLDRRRAGSRRRSSRSRCPTATAAPALFDTDEHPRADSTIENAGRAAGAAPRARRRPRSPPATRPGSTTAPPRSC